MSTSGDGFFTGLVVVVAVSFLVVASVSVVSAVVMDDGGLIFSGGVESSDGGVFVEEIIPALTPEGTGGGGVFGGGGLSDFALRGSLIFIMELSPAIVWTSFFSGERICSSESLFSFGEISADFSVSNGLL